MTSEMIESAWANIVFFSPQSRPGNTKNSKKTWMSWLEDQKKRQSVVFHHHHHVVPLARISLTLSRHFSLSFIASGRSSRLHPVSSHSCCMYVLTGRPAFAWSYVGVHWSTSLMSSSLLLQQCPTCLVRLTWIVFMMGGRWPYSWCLVECCCQDLFNIAHNTAITQECCEQYWISPGGNTPQSTNYTAVVFKRPFLSLSLSVNIYIYVIERMPVYKCKYLLFYFHLLLDFVLIIDR